MFINTRVGLIGRIFCIVLLATPALYAQSVKEQKHDAIHKLDSGHYTEALSILQNLYRNGPHDPDISTALAKAYLYTNQTAESLDLIDRTLALDKKNQAELYYLKACNLHLRHNFSEAIRWYKSALSFKKSEKNAAAIKDQIIRCATGLKLSKVQGNYIIDNLGNTVNTIHDEFAPILSPNYSTKLYFASANDKSNGGQRNDQGIADVYGSYSSDIYESFLINGTWTNTNPISYMINGPRNEYITGFSGRGKEMYFFRGFTLYSGDILVDTFQKNIDQQMNPQYYRGPVNAAKGDRDLTFVNDTLICFSSNRPGGYGGFDIYFSKLVKGRWTEAVNAGDAINSAYDEVTPFLKDDATVIYFSSNCLNSIGGFDIFSSTYDAVAKKWSLPTNAGIPFNSAADDLYFRLAPGEYYGYFASSRLESYGKRDIFSVYFPDIIINSIRENVAEVTETDIQKSEANLKTNQNSNTSVQTLYGHEKKEIEQDFEVQSMFWDDATKLLTPKNVQYLNSVTTILKQNKSVRLILTGHVAGTSDAKADAYISLRQAENIRDYLQKNDVNEKQILVRGAGRNFPIIKDDIPANASVLKQNLSNRVDLAFSQQDDAGIQFEYQELKVMKSLADERYNIYRLSNIGLMYRVQVAATTQANHSQILDAYPDFIIEKRPKSDLLFYLIGNKDSYSEISLLRTKINNSGVKDAFIVAYVDGWPITRNQAIELKRMYPDLENFIKEGK